MKDIKNITYKHLKPGMKIQGWEESGTTRLASSTVKEVNPAFVTLMVFDKTEEKVSSNCLFRVELTVSELIAKYQTKAEEVIQNIQNMLPSYEIGYHEMWNAWLSYNPYEIAQHCNKEKITILGHCTDIIPKAAMFSGDILDVGICASYENGEKFWCHYKMDNLNKMVEDFNIMKNFLGLFTEDKQQKIIEMYAEGQYNEIKEKYNITGEALHNALSFATYWL